MINITIGLDGVPSESRVVLGNQWENIDEVIQFDLPSDFENYHKYMVAVHRTKLNDESYKTITRVLPINNNQFVVSTDITPLAGNWYMYVMCREGQLDLNVEEINLSPLNNEHVWIANSFFGVVNKTYIEKESIDNLPMDGNLNILYEDLLKIRDELTQFDLEGIDNLQSKEDENLATENKTVVGAINELKNKFNSLVNGNEVEF